MGTITAPRVYSLNILRDKELVQRCIKRGIHYVCVTCALGCRNFAFFLLQLKFEALGCMQDVHILVQVKNKNCFLNKFEGVLHTVLQRSKVKDSRASVAG